MSKKIQILDPDKKLAFCINIFVIVLWIVAIEINNDLSQFTILFGIGSYFMSNMIANLIKAKDITNKDE